MASFTGKGRVQVTDDSWIDVWIGGYSNPGRTYGPAENCYPAESDSEVTAAELVVELPGSHPISGGRNLWRIDIPPIVAEMMVGSDAWNEAIADADYDDAGGA